MVGNGQETALDALEMLDSAAGEAVGGPGQDAVDHPHHHFVLELVDAADAAEHVAHRGGRDRREKIFGHHRHHRVPGHPGKGLYGLCISIRAYVLEFILVHTQQIYEISV